MLGYRHTEETKKRLSEVNTGKVLTEAAKLNLSEIAKQQWNNTDMRDKVRLKLTGVKRSEEFREKCRLNSTGKKHTEEEKEKIKASTKAATSSPEKRAKMSEVAKKSWWERHEGKTGLTEDVVRTIRELQGWMSASAVGRAFDISRRTVSRIWKGEICSHII